MIKEIQETAKSLWPRKTKKCDKCGSSLVPCDCYNVNYGINQNHINDVKTCVQKYRNIEVSHILVPFDQGISVKRTYKNKQWFKEEKFLNDELHCDDGPAILYSDGTELYWKHGRLHREGGPAVKWANNTEEYWVDGVQY